MIEDEALALVAELRRISRAYTALAWGTIPLRVFLVLQLILRDEKDLPLAGIFLLQLAEWWTRRQLKGKAVKVEARFSRWAAEHGYAVKPGGEG